MLCALFARLSSSRSAGVTIYALMRRCSYVGCLEGGEIRCATSAYRTYQHVFALVCARARLLCCALPFLVRTRASHLKSRNASTALRPAQFSQCFGTVRLAQPQRFRGRYSSAFFWRQLTSCCDQRWRYAYLCADDQWRGAVLGQQSTRAVGQWEQPQQQCTTTCDPPRCWRGGDRCG